MPIQFHCPFCNRMIKAPDEHGGKHGKCPSCQQRVYIPTADDALEPLTLEPVDNSAERERERLIEESRRLEKTVLGETKEPPAGASRPAAGPASPPPPPMPVAEIEKAVVRYATKMAAGDLNDAEKVAAQLRPHAARVEQVTQRILMDELPPAELAKIPKPVLIAFFKQLLGK